MREKRAVGGLLSECGGWSVCEKESLSLFVLTIFSCDDYFLDHAVYAKVVLQTAVLVTLSKAQRAITSLPSCPHSALSAMSQGVSSVERSVVLGKAYKWINASVLLIIPPTSQQADNDKTFHRNGKLYLCAVVGLFR